MRSRLSLRARLLLAVIALAAVGLLAADVATYASLSSFLVDRTDSSLDQAHNSAEQVIPAASHEEGRAPGPQGDNQFSVGADYVQVRRLDGTIVTSVAPHRSPGDAAVPKPELQKTIQLAPATDGQDSVRYFTVQAVSGGERYRVRAAIEGDATNYVLLVAASLHDVDSTLHRLLWIELLVTTLVLAGIGAVGLWVVRLSLRPLDAIGATAAAIAGGELSRRIERAVEKTEVGRLGMSLNAMLAQIEAAFKSRAESERKLRRFLADA